MEIPDCYEAFYQEEQRQRLWDEYLERLPECVLCHRKIMPGEPYHYSGDKAVCFECFDELSENEALVDAD